MKKFFTILAFLAVVFVATAAIRYRVYSNADIYIQTGEGVTTSNGTVTNTFTVAFGAVPRVIVSQKGTVQTVSNIVVSITTSNFIYDADVTGVTNQYIAIGTP